MRGGLLSFLIMLCVTLVGYRLVQVRLDRWLDQRYCPVKEAAPDEILVLVSDFHGTGGVVPVPRLLAALRKELAASSLVGVRLEHAAEAPMLPEDAHHLANKCRATILIWGTYDGYGITPHFLAAVHDLSRARTPPPQDVSFEEIPNEPTRPEDFSSYIRRGMSDEMAYFTLLTLGQLQYFQGNHDDALDTLHRALQSIPEHAYHELRAEYAYWSIGIIYGLQQDWPMMIEAFTCAIDCCTPTAEAYYNRAFAFYEEGRYEDAIADLTQATDLDPESAIAQHNLGAAQAALGNYALAIPHYLKALDIDSERALTHYALAVAYHHTGENQRMIFHLEEATRIDPEFVQAYTSLGLVQAAMGSSLPAYFSFTHAIVSDPNYGPPYCYRGILLCQTKAFVFAKPDLQRCLQLAPSDIEPALTDARECLRVTHSR